MQKLLMASVAAIGLTTAGLAYAQEAAPAADPAAPAAQPMSTPPEVVAPVDPAAANSDMPAAGAASTAAENTGDEAGSTFGSYKNTDPGSFSGTIAGNHSADDLIGQEIVDGEGTKVGDVSDLLIGSDGSIQNVLVDVGGFLGIGTRTVALDLSQVQMAQGDGEDLVVNMTKEQVEALPAVEQNDQGWGMAPPSAAPAQ